MKPICIIACVAIFPFLAFAEADREEPSPSQLQGTYTIVRGERDGKALPKSDFEASVIKITKDKMLGTDKEKKEFFACTYTLDTSKKPWTVRMTSTAPKEGEKSEGVIEVDGSTVRICYNLPGGKRPTSFKAGEKQHFFELKRSSR